MSFLFFFYLLYIDWLFYVVKTDQNECDQGNGGCSDICSNTEGSFECSCNVGYQLAEDNLTCIGLFTFYLFILLLDKIFLALSILRLLADNKLDVTYSMEFFFHRVKIIFSFPHNVFKTFFQDYKKSELCIK